MESTSPSTPWTPTASNALWARATRTRGRTPSTTASPASQAGTPPSAPLRRAPRAARGSTPLRSEPRSRRLASPAPLARQLRASRALIRAPTALRARPPPPPATLRAPRAYPGRTRRVKPPRRAPRALPESKGAGSRECAKLTASNTSCTGTPIKWAWNRARRASQASSPAAVPWCATHAPAAPAPATT